MRIVFLTNLCARRPGLPWSDGADSLAAAYRRLGHEVVVAAQEEPADWEKTEEKYPDGIGGRRLKSGGVLLLGGTGAPFSLRRAFATFAGLWRLLRRSDFVHLHTAGEWGAVSLAFWLAAWLKRVRVGVSFHMFDAARVVWRRGWALRLRKFFLLRGAWVTAWSNHSAEGIASELPYLAGKIRIVGDGWLPEEINPLVRGGKAAAGRPPYVFCQWFKLDARQIAFKGYDVALWAWKDACAVAPETELVFAGRDPVDDYFPRMARLLGISSRVRFVGDLQRQQYLEMLGSSLFLVLPSRHEPFGKGCFEAMAMGKAVVAAATGGPLDYVKNGHSGILVAPGNVAELRTAVERLLLSPAEREGMGRRGREAVKPMTWDRVAASYLSLGPP